MTESTSESIDFFEPGASAMRELPAAQELRSRRSSWAALRDRWPIWLVAGVTLANGLLSIGSVLALRFAEAPKFFALPVPFGVHHLSRSLTLAFGFVLIYLSVQLLQRRRAAWWLTLGFAVAATLAHLGRGHFWHFALGPLLVIALLLVFRQRYTVHSEVRSIAQGVGLMLASLMLALAYGTLGFWLLDKRDFGIEFTVEDALLRTLRQFTLIGNADLVAHTRHAEWFLVSLQVIGVVALVFAVYSLFRPVAYRLRTLPHQRAQVKELLEQHGGSALDYFKLWPDKSYYFSHDHRCCIAYKTVWGVALGLGDPAGDRQEVGDTLRSFMRFCTDNGWQLALHQVFPDLLPIYQEVGLQTLKIGEEAVVDLERFSATFQGSKHMRKTRNRFAKEAYTIAWYEAPHSPDLLDEAQKVSDAWLTLPGHRERTFSLGDFNRSYLNETSLVAVRSADGQMIAFVNLIPSYRRGEATIDLMRHQPEVPNGTMDFLFIELLLQLKDRGYKLFNLGMAPFAGVGEEPDSSRQERAAHYLSEQLGRWVSYKGIRDYKAKFDPIWEDRYLVYQGGPVGLVKTALALTRATEE